MNDKNDKVKAPSYRPNALPDAGFGLMVDGKIKSHHDSLESVVKAGTELKKKFPVVQVYSYDAAEKTRTPIDVDAVKTES